MTAVRRMTHSARVGCSMLTKTSVPDIPTPSRTCTASMKNGSAPCTRSCHACASGAALLDRSALRTPGGAASITPAMQWWGWGHLWVLRSCEIMGAASIPILAYIAFLPLWAGPVLAAEVMDPMCTTSPRQAQMRDMGVKRAARSARNFSSCLHASNSDADTRSPGSARLLCAPSCRAWAQCRAVAA